MLIHIVVWKYREEVSVEERRKHVEKLSILPGLIPEIKSFKLGKDVLRIERSYDTGLVAEFDGLEALEAYTVHEAHQEAAAFGRKISAHVASVDFFDPPEME